MKKPIFFVTALVVASLMAEDTISCVDTLIGGSYRGHTFPGAAAPFSMVQASPDSGRCDWDHCSGYVWEDAYAYGFSQTHLSGTGCPDLEDVRLLPFSQDFANRDPREWKIAKDFRTEVGRPGYYTAAYTNQNIKVESTATPHVGVWRFTYAPNQPVKLLVDFQWVNAGNQNGAVVEFANQLGKDGRSMTGHRRTHAWLQRTVAWKLVCDRAWQKATKLPAQDAREKGDRWVLEFAPGAPLVVKVAVSTVDEEGAAKNGDAEVKGKEFGTICQETQNKWREVLGRFEIPGATKQQKIAFYTALYHLSIQPNNIADVDGRYRGGDAKVAQARDGVYYTGLSLWDTFRAAHPYYTLAAQERVDGFVNSMLGHYRAMGFLPVIPYFGWESHCMIGNHSIPVIVDAYRKGFRGFDVAEAFTAVTNSITLKHRDPFGNAKIKEEWDWYDQYGYYPCDKIRGESVSRTLECGFNDWCAAEFCQMLGKGDEAFFRKRSNYWKNVFDSSLGFMRGKDSNGKWRTPFDPFSLGHGGDTSNDFTEGNAFQYTWHVLQDPDGLIAALGGKDAFVKKLNSLFVQPERVDGMGFVGDVTGLIGQYAHGNEPSHHVAYFYSIAGCPDRTAEVVREVCDRFYGVKPGDLCGNDDCGQMSAWYVFAAMGFYPFNPASGKYVLGAPQYPEVTLKLPNGKRFHVIARNLSKENKYVKRVTLNGRELKGPYLQHADVVAGGELVFEMQSKGGQSVTVALAKRGEKPAFTIVTPAKPSASEAYAATELRDFLAKVTGVTLPITVEGLGKIEHGIYIGETEFASRVVDADARKRLGYDGFRLAVCGGDVLVYGSKRRGALYGVYEVLEKFAGCKWYSSWYSVIPVRDEVSIPKTLLQDEVPAFAMREPFWYDVLEHPDFAARLRVNNRSWRTGDKKYGENDFRFGGGLGSCHTFNVLMPPDEFYDKHPEYYSLENGARLKNPSQLCLTNPDVLRIVTERVLERIRRDPGDKFYGVSQNDWYHYCQCDKCKAIDEEEESHAGTMIRFVNAVAERVEKEFPDVIIETLAYQYTRKPPKKTKLRHNVVPCLCTIECDFARPLDVSKYPQNVSFCKDISGWKTQTDALYVWDYTTDFSHYPRPFANVYALQGNLKFFRDNNVKEIFEQGAYQGRHADFAELKAWLLAKLMWNPDQDLEPLLKDFFQGYYGKAATFVRAYFEALHRKQLAYSEDSKHPLVIFGGVYNPALDEEFYKQAAIWWDQAAHAVKGDAARAYNVRMGAFSLDYARLEVMRRKGDKALWLRTDGPDWSRFNEQKALAQSLLARMDEAKNIRLSEGHEPHNQRISAWKQIVAREIPKCKGTPERGVLEESFITCGNRGSWGDYVDDPLAEDGKALKLFNTHFEWCCQFHICRVAFEPGVKYTLRMRARVEKASEGEAFWSGIYDPVAKCGRGGIQPKTSEAPNTYQWYDVCTWVPKDDEYFWIGPGRFNKDGKSAIKGVWIDKFEFVRVK